MLFAVTAGPPHAEPLDPRLPAALARAGAYPDDPSAALGVEHVQTHLSHVFLTRDRVYKLHKAARFAFVDFGTRAARNEDSLREVRLNRRLAPDVYLGVSAVRVDGETAVLAPPSESLAGTAEHCVVMRRLPAGRDMLSLLERGALQGAHVDAIARLIAALHDRAGLGAPAPFPAAEWQARVRGPLLESLEALEAGALRERAAQLRARALARLVHCAGRLETRRRAGRIVDGHGDLHLQHVWFEREEAPPVAIDCLEFRDDYRQIDAASEVAFLAMDLEYRDRRDLGERFLRRYAELRDDFDLYGVVDLFIAYRAAVRAKVAGLATEDEALAAEQRARAAQSAERHLALVAGALEVAPPGAVVAMAGIVGSGKSTAAQALADATGGAVIASDRVRKRQAGLEPTARGHAELYTDERSDAVYAGLLERAAPVVLSGRVAILDATFARARFRNELRRWGALHGVPTRLVETVCGREETLARLAERERAASDPSDAGPALLEASSASFEPVDDWPAAERARIATDDPDWPAALERAAHELAGGRASRRGRISS